MAELGIKPGVSDSKPMLLITMLYHPPFSIEVVLLLR